MFPKNSIDIFDNFKISGNFRCFKCFKCFKCFEFSEKYANIIQEPYFGNLE